MSNEHHDKDLNDEDYHYNEHGLGKYEYLQGNLRIVVYTAARMKTRLPSCIRIEELISVGLDGLVEAMENFDWGENSKPGLKFETLLSQAVRGAIFNYLKSLDWEARLLAIRQSNGNSDPCTKPTKQG